MNVTIHGLYLHPTKFMNSGQIFHLNVKDVKRGPKLYCAGCGSAASQGKPRHKAPGMLLRPGYHSTGSLSRSEHTSSQQELAAQTQGPRTPRKPEAQFLATQLL